MSRYDVQDISTLQDDFHKGIVGRISPLGLKKGSPPPPYVKSASNLIFRPARAFSVRPGYRDVSQVVLSEPPVAMGKHYHASGNKMFVATNSGGGAGALWRYSTSSRTAQTLPWTPTDKRWQFEMANGLLVGCQSGLAQKPIFYTNTNAANTWLPMTLPAPASAPTFGTNAAGGALAVTKDYFVRVRWNYTNGSSKASPASAARQLVAASGNYTLLVNIPRPASPRSDYLGWTLERTKQNGSVNGPWFRVFENGTADTYSDGASDASLFHECDELLHGEPVAMEGVISHRGRLFGWAGSSLYVSQPIVGDEGTGICNWIGDAVFPVGEDDGDTIQQVVIQGDRLLIGKRHSLWTLDGDDENSFRLVIRFEGAGFCGSRAAAPLGGTVFFAATDGRFFVMRGNSVEPLAAEEVGDYLNDMDTGRDAEIIALNYLGDFILFWYVPNGHAYADEVLAYDLKFGNWSHHDNMPAVDAIVQKDTADFGGATLLFADPRLLPPGNTGVSSTNPSFVAWADARSSTNSQAFIQKMTSVGAPEWTANGVQVSNSTGVVGTGGRALHPIVVSDGADGCIVLWNDYRNGSFRRGDIYAQKYNAAGAPQWAPGGVLAWAANNSTENSALAAACADGLGGAVFAFWAASDTLYIESINSSGVNFWAGGVVKLYDPWSSWVNAKQVNIHPAGGGAVFVTWQGIFDGSLGYANRFIQKFSAAGVALIGVSSAHNYGATLGGNLNMSYSSPESKMSCRNGSGGLFFVDAQGSYTLRLMACDSAGTQTIGANGAPVDALATGYAYPSPTVCSDGGTGCFVAWVECVATVYRVRVRRFLATGSPVWATLGLDTIPASAAYPPDGLCIIEDGSGGAIVSWNYSADTPAAHTAKGLHASRVNGDGTIAWADREITPYAQMVRNTPYQYWTLGRGVSDGAGGAIFVWPDIRDAIGTPTAHDIYAQRVGPDGSDLWTPGGVAVCNYGATGAQDDPFVYFSGANEAEYPDASAAGYHVWCGLSGTRDKASADGSGGDLIPVRIKGHFYDDGMPNNTKDYEWFELYVNRGSGTIVAAIETDTGSIATVVLDTNATAPEYDTGLLYDAGLEYGTSGQAKVGVGLNKGTEGRACSVSLSGNLEDMEIGGWMLQAFVLPRKEY